MKNDVLRKQNHFQILLQRHAVYFPNEKTIMGEEKEQKIRKTKEIMFQV